MDFIARPMPLPKPPNMPDDFTVKKLFNFNSKCIDNCSNVRAAIAYGSRDNMGLLNDCRLKNKHLEFYGRYDGSCPIDPTILRWFLDCKSPNIQYRAVPKWLHAKVIWWVGQGAYIGSANLTDRAWNKNFEAGIFMTDEELEHFSLLDELGAFFDGLRTNSQPLNEEMYQAQLALFKQRETSMSNLRKLEEDFNDRDPLVKATDSPITASPSKNEATRYQKFAAEWNATLQHMRAIAGRVSLPENRPHWIDEDVPTGVQADQFLHAYYYERVREGNEKDAHEAFFNRHRKNPEMALQEALDWWKRSEFSYHNEKHMISVSAPAIFLAFSKNHILSLSESEWVDAVSRVHAFGDHAAKMSNVLLGLPETQQSAAHKTERFAHWLWHQRTAAGKSPLEVIHYVVWGAGELTRRLWDGCHHPDWKLPHIRVSTLGEIIGWANPTVYPPRNMRTSKGLRALGIDVDVNL